MDILTIQKRFADELAAIRSVNSTRSRRYSRELKKAIMDLYATGVSIEEIRDALALSHGALNSWVGPRRLKKRHRDAFAPINVDMSVPQDSALARSLDFVVIELSSGVTIRIRQ